MSTIGRLLFPALRWHDEHGFAQERAVIDRALRIGVGGFSIFGGDAAAVRELTTALRAGSNVPLLIASDFERGAGQQFPQATPLPPLAAIGALDELQTTRRAAALTAREALAVGVNWIFAPVADVDLEPRNPIVGSRAFGTDAAHVAAHVAAWIEGAAAEGALCCAKHFPGHGRTVDDSHAALPRVTATRAQLETDLEPFRAAIEANVASLMTAHVAYDALDATTAATLSYPILTTLLRDELGFDGLVVSDALIMEGMIQAGGGSEIHAAIAALNAGCDALLYPSDLQHVATALEKAFGNELQRARVDEAMSRIERTCERALTHTDAKWRKASDARWANDIALRSCTVARGNPRGALVLDVLTIDDDLGGPFAAPARDHFMNELRSAGARVTAVAQPAAQTALCIAVYCDIRAWKGSPRLTEQAAAQVRAALAVKPDATVVFFGHPRLVDAVPGENVLAAWGGEPIMQRAAAQWLTQRR